MQHLHFATYSVIIMLIIAEHWLMFRI